jgi:RimJ/RimL family protein N-acetyltransferase
VSIRLQGPRVTLRAFREGEFDVLWAEESRDRGPHESPWPEEAREVLRTRCEGSGQWQGGSSLLLAVEADNRLVGDVNVRTSREVFPPGVFELGIGLFSSGRDRGYGTEVLQVLSSYLFDDELAARVQLGTDVANAPMRRAAEKAGFRFEGVMRGYWAMPDEPVKDFALYGRTRADHEGRE